jgi:hypothetical protein
MLSFPWFWREFGLALHFPANFDVIKAGQANEQWDHNLILAYLGHGCLEVPSLLLSCLQGGPRNICAGTRGNIVMYHILERVTKHEQAGLHNRAHFRIPSWHKTDLQPNLPPDISP